MSEGLTGKATPGNEIIGFYIVSLIGKVLLDDNEKSKVEYFWQKKSVVNDAYQKKLTLPLIYNFIESKTYHDLVSFYCESLSDQAYKIMSKDIIPIILSLTNDKISYRYNNGKEFLTIFVEMNNALYLIFEQMMRILNYSIITKNFDTAKIIMYNCQQYNTIFSSPYTALWYRIVYKKYADFQDPIIDKCFLNDPCCFLHNFIYDIEGNIVELMKNDDIFQKDLQDILNFDSYDTHVVVNGTEIDYSDELHTEHAFSDVRNQAADLNYFIY